MMQFFLICRHNSLIFTWHILCFIAFTFYGKYVCIIYCHVKNMPRVLVSNLFGTTSSHLQPFTGIRNHLQLASSLLWLGSSALFHHKLTECAWHTSLYTIPQELWHYNVFIISSPRDAESKGNIASSSCLTVVHVCGLGHMFSVILSGNVAFLWLWYSEFH